jgi:hypothetical protein
MASMRTISSALKMGQGIGGNLFAAAPFVLLFIGIVKNYGYTPKFKGGCTPVPVSGRFYYRSRSTIWL